MFEVEVLGTEFHDALVNVAISHQHAFPVEMDIGGVAEVFLAQVAACLLTGTNLADVFAIGGKVQHDMIAAAIATDPNVQVIIHVKPVDIGGPLLVTHLLLILALAFHGAGARRQLGAAPATQQIAFPIELQDMRRRAATSDTLPVVGTGITEAKRIGAVEHPDIIVPVHGQSRCLAQDHVFRQARPARIHCEGRHRCSFAHALLVYFHQRIGQRGSGDKGDGREGRSGQYCTHVNFSQETVMNWRSS